jgi:hypothetical protein
VLTEVNRSLKLLFPSSKTIKLFKSLESLSVGLEIGRAKPALGRARPGY